MTRLAWGAATDVGRVREHNEDNLHAGPRLFAVADGMGGHAAGEVASALAIESLAELGEAESLTVTELARAIFQGNRLIIRSGLRNPSTLGMGTTLTGIALISADADHDERWAVFNIGDSRVYRYLDSELEQLTEDHSEVQELVNAGRLSREQARRYPRRNVITRSLGSLPDPEADLWLRPVVPGERFVVCSDGLTGELTDGEIAEVLARTGDPTRNAADLLSGAVDAGGNDNVTVIVVAVDSDGDGDVDGDGSERYAEEGVDRIPDQRG